MTGQHTDPTGAPAAAGAGDSEPLAPVATVDALGLEPEDRAVEDARPHEGAEGEADEILDRLAEAEAKRDEYLKKFGEIFATQ